MIQDTPTPHPIPELDREATARYFDGSMSLEEAALFEAQVRHAVASRLDWVKTTADELVTDLGWAGYDVASVEVCRRIRFLDAVGRGDGEFWSLAALHRDTCPLCRSMPRTEAGDPAGRLWSIVVGVVLTAALLFAILLLGTAARAPDERDVRLPDLPLELGEVLRGLSALQMRSFGGDDAPLEDLVLLVSLEDGTYLDRIARNPGLRTIFADMGLPPGDSPLKTRLALMMALLQDTRLVAHQRLVALDLIQELAGARAVPFLIRMAESARDDTVFTHVLCRLFEMVQVTNPDIVATHLIDVALDRGFSAGARLLLEAMIAFAADDAVPVAFAILEGQGQLDAPTVEVAAGFIRDRMKGVARLDLTPQLERLARIGSPSVRLYTLLILQDASVPGDWGSQLNELEAHYPTFKERGSRFRPDRPEASGSHVPPDSLQGAGPEQPADERSRAPDPSPAWR